MVSLVSVSKILGEQETSRCSFSFNFQNRNTTPIPVLDTFENLKHLPFWVYENLEKTASFQSKNQQKKTHWFPVGPLTGFFDWIRIWVKGQKTGSMISENQWRRMMRTSNGLRVEARLIPVLIMRVTKAVVTLHKKNLYGKHFPILQNPCRLKGPLYSWLTWEFSAI
jgi:hypothetical protein